MYDVYIDTLPCYMVLVSLHHVLFAPIVHTSLSWLVNLAYMIGTKAQFAIRTCFWYRFHDFPLLPYDMCCNGTGQWACILQCFWYRDVPSICYHLFVLEIRLLNSMLKFRYEVLHYYLSFDYLCIIFGRLTSCTPLPALIVTVHYVLWFVIGFTHVLHLGTFVTYVSCVSLPVVAMYQYCCDVVTFVWTHSRGSIFTATLSLHLWRVQALLP